MVSDYCGLKRKIRAICQIVPHGCTHITSHHVLTRSLYRVKVAQRQKVVFLMLKFKKKTKKKTQARHIEILTVQFSCSKNPITQRHRGERQKENQYIISVFQRGVSFKRMNVFIHQSDVAFHSNQ